MCNRNSLQIVNADDGEDFGGCRPVSWRTEVSLIHRLPGTRNNKLTDFLVETRLCSPNRVRCTLARPKLINGKNAPWTMQQYSLLDPWKNKLYCYHLSKWTVFYVLHMCSYYGFVFFNVRSWFWIFFRMVAVVDPREYGTHSGVRG